MDPNRNPNDPRRMGSNPPPPSPPPQYPPSYGEPRAEEAHERIDDMESSMTPSSGNGDSGNGRRDDVPEGQRRVMTDDDIEIITGGEDLGVYRARRRFGGFDLGASIAGLMAGVGLMAVLAGIAGGVGTVGYQYDAPANADTVTTGGFIAGLAIIVLSFLFAGWVAGRSARYDGGRNGVITAVLSWC